MLQNTRKRGDCQEQGGPTVASGDKRQLNLTSLCQCDLQCYLRWSQGQTRWVSSLCSCESSLRPFPTSSRPHGLSCMSHRTGVVFWLPSGLHQWEALAFCAPRVAMTNGILPLPHPPRSLLSGGPHDMALCLQGHSLPSSCAASGLEEVMSAAALAPWAASSSWVSHILPCIGHTRQLERATSF